MSMQGPPSQHGSSTSLEAAYLNAPVALCIIGRDMRCMTANEPLARIFGRPLPEIIGRHIDAFIPGTAARVERGFAKADAGETVTDYEFPMPGTGKTYLIVVKPFRDGSEGIIGLSVAMLDISERKRIAEILRETEQRAAYALESAGQWIWEMNIPGNTVWRSPHWKTHLGFAPDEKVIEDETEAWGIVHPDDRRDIEKRFHKIVDGQTTFFEATYRVRHKSGQWLWILSRGKIVEQDAMGKPIRLLATSVDISKQKQIEQELAATVRQREILERELVDANRRLTTLSEMDSLTELPNRRKFDDVLAKEIRRSGRHTPSLALLMIDVDHFKSYNDLYGHPEGDECLRRVAETLRLSARRSGDVITRYGGEEFAAVLASTNEAEALAVASRMLHAVRAMKLAHAGSSLNIVTISVGITVYAPDGSGDMLSSDALVRAADRALYAAKLAGRNCIAASNIGGDGAIRTMLVTETGMSSAVAPPGSEALR
ncbi:MAG TPA: diguanylate cyclase [Reyranella sp.]|nr:diguanylate cyclase [Reyranella sp.]